MPASGSTRASSPSVNRVPFVSVIVGRIPDSSASVSGSHGSRKGSPPVIPSERKPSSRASPAARSRASRGSVRRFAIPGNDSVRQYAQARLQW